jgi:hypothetical protein
MTERCDVHLSRVSLSNSALNARGSPSASPIVTDTADFGDATQGRVE